MLRLQPASPSTVGAVAVAPSETAVVDEPLRSSPSSFNTGEPSSTPAWLIKLGIPPVPTTKASAPGGKTESLLIAAQTQQGM